MQRLRLFAVLPSLVSLLDFVAFPSFGKGSLACAPQDKPGHSAMRCAIAAEERIHTRASYTLGSAETTTGRLCETSAPKVQERSDKGKPTTLPT